MERDQRIGAALAAATCSLLGISSPAPSIAAEPDSKWDVDSAFLFYGESDSRVQDLSLAASAVRDFGDEHRLALEGTIDSLTGASPNGAMATAGAQTFTSPSARGAYSTLPGQVPLDSTFHDMRTALNASWSQPFARLYSVSAGLGFSNEFDYTHIGGNLAMTRDFNERNTTLSIAAAYANDSVKPVGGLHTPLSLMADSVNRDDEEGGTGGSKKKNVLDLLFGVTQVLGRHGVLRVNYSYSDETGYLTDPYKILSVVDPVTGDLVSRTPPPGAEGPLGLYRYESRPDTRRKQALYAELRQDFSGKVLQLAYRYAKDDWQVDSQTLEARLHLPWGESNYFEPHVRYYKQTAASFYRYSLADTIPLPEFASADARLAALDTYTVGLKFAHTMADGSEWSARLELYDQKAKAPVQNLIGNQVGNTKMPDFNAVILQFGYHFKL